ncbi:MAG: hypothetical protein Fur0019_14390 [Tibeticola sp.]
MLTRETRKHLTRGLALGTVADEAHATNDFFRARLVALGLGVARKKCTEKKEEQIQASHGYMLTKRINS